MNSPSPASRHASRRTDSATVQPSLAPADRERPAANDDVARTTLDDFKDPLWVLAIGMWIFFALMAALIAAG